MAEVSASILMDVVLPMWVAASLLDWLCHRPQVERAGGLRQNLLQLLMALGLGLSMLSVALLQANAALLLIVLASLSLHELAAYGDQRFGAPLRRVYPFERMVHSFIELLPLLALALLAVAHWEQALALFGAGPVAPDFSVRVQADPLPPFFLAGALLGALLLHAVPLLQESWRCWKARRNGVASARTRPSPGPR